MNESKISLREITEKNFNECIDLQVEPHQKNFVASNVYSLAQAWLYPASARPFGIYHEDAMVGFLMLDINSFCDDQNKVCELWRFMIDRRRQGRGYGRAAMRALLEYIKESAMGYEKARLSFEPENEVAEKLYRSFGFEPNGEVDGGEVVMVLELRGGQ